MGSIARRALAASWFVLLLSVPGVRALGTSDPSADAVIDGSLIERAGVRDAQVEVAQEASADAPANEVPGPLVIERGEGHASLPVPRDEKLVYKVTVDVGLFEATAGTVTMTSKVEPWQTSLLLAGDEDLGDVGVFHIHAKGKYSFYNLDAKIETRVLPQEWPRFSYRYTHEGSEKRRREIQLGERGDVYRASYRGDTRKNAPKGQRVWRERQYRDVPQETVDMLSAVYLARRMVESGDAEMTFPLIDKLRLWQMKLKRGKTGNIKTEAGTFECTRLQLIPGVWPGDEAEMTEKQKEKFEGLFGLKGAIELMVHKETGVPVRIRGDLPAGPWTFEVDVELQSYTGTPDEFLPVGKR